MSIKPIRRHEALVAFSKDHHQGLLLCWKIREGLKKNVEPERIKIYADWFWQNHLEQHFDEEEKYIFNILPPNDPLIIQALAEHQRLKSLFESDQNIYESLSLIEKELDAHIRFEERILFNKIQEIADTQQLEKIAEIHKDEFCEIWEDQFWTNKPASK